MNATQKQEVIDALVEYVKRTANKEKTATAAELGALAEIAKVLLSMPSLMKRGC